MAEMSGNNKGFTDRPQAIASGPPLPETRQEVTGEHADSRGMMGAPGDAGRGTALYY